MSLVLDLPEAEQSKLLAEADRRGVEPEALAQSWLSERLVSVQPPFADGKLTFSEMLRDWIENGDEAEQRETYEAIRRGVNENRVGQRKPFVE